jgi:peptidoglycan/LPS O-acetylase OafA/YrhL
MKPRQHYAILDGMRGVAAVIVVIFHTAQTHDSNLPLAALAVDFFFLMSGFVVAYAYEARLQSTLGFPAFVCIRLARLYPLILFGVSCGIALTVLHLYTLHDISSRQVAIGAVVGLLLLPCYVYPQWDTAYPMNLPSWSLFFELTINGVYALCARHLNTARLLFITAASCVVLVATCFHAGSLQGFGNNKVGFLLGFVRVTFPFFAGVALYRFRRPVVFAPYLSWVLPIVLAVLLLSPIHDTPVTDLIYVIVLFPVIILFGSSISAGPRVTQFFFFSGRMSYPIYITHQPLLRAFSQIGTHLHLNGPLFYAAEVSVCLLAAYCALRFYDEPLRAWLNGLGQPMAFPVEAATESVLSMPGLAAGDSELGTARDTVGRTSLPF